MIAMTDRVEWMSVLAFALVIGAVIAVFAGWVNSAEGSAIMGAAVVSAILSLRAR